MANYKSLKTTINANVKRNGKQEITGQILNSVLTAMVDTLGTGYSFAGVATPATNPGTPDAKVFYIANGKGTYTHFGELEVTEDDVVVLCWDSLWHKESTGIAREANLTNLEKEVATKQNALTDTDGGYGQRVAKLEKEGIASQEKLSELSAEVSLLSAGINGENINIDALDVVKAFPNNNGNAYVWYIGGSSYLGTFIRVSRGIKLSIKGNASADTSYCFVKEIGKINGEEVKFASNSIFTVIEWGKTISIVAPEDAVYLWVSMGIKVPQRISIESRLADVLHVSNIVNNLYDGGSDKVLSAEQGKTLNDKIESIPLKASQEYTIENVEVVRHYADNTKWIIDYMPSEYTGCYIPVNGGDVFSIVASDTITIYAFIKSKGVNNGDAIDFAGDATSTSRLNPNVQEMVYAPNDAKFLWVCVKYNNNNSFPKSLIKEGDKVQTIGKWSLRNTTENPLEIINMDGGFARIFKNWGFIGDSFTSGNHNFYNKEGVDVGGDIFEYSWGEYIKQILGCDGYEYSTGGWTCKDWIDATNGRGWDKLQTEKRQVYTIALGCNDASPEISYALGTPSDIKSDYNQNPDTFYGNYAGIIQRIKSIQPKAIIFCITLPSGDRAAAETYNAAIRYMAEKFSNVYIIDFYKYAPPVNKEWGNTFRNRYHLNAMGYLYTAWEILTYIDWIIRKNPLYFRDVAFIGDDNKFVTQDSNVYGNNGL